VVLLVSSNMLTSKYNMETNLPSPPVDRGVPIVILMQLLMDLEAHGGLHGPSSLKALCNRRPDIYGQVATSRRRAIQNKVHRLKNMTRLAYLELLAEYGIPAYRPVLPLQLSPYALQSHQPPVVSMDATMVVQPANSQTTRGLPKSLLRLLLQDIQAQGGRKDFVLRTLCNLRPEVYGSPGSALRRAIQNKTNYIKSLNAIEYHELLIAVGILPASAMNVP
jgi:hypothetical protein